MTNRALLVFTVEGPDSIRRNGSGYWPINRDRAKEYEYVVFCQNKNLSDRNRGVWDHATATHNHGDAFLVGRLVEVVSSDEAKGRYEFKLSEVAEIEPRKLWYGDRFPVKYEGTLEGYGLDLATLQFVPVPTEPPAAMSEMSGPAKLALPVAASQANEPTSPPATTGSALADIETYAAMRLGVRREEIEVTVSLNRRAAGTSAASTTA
jgi:hypothetical protein